MSKYQFGPRSFHQLVTLHPDLRKVLAHALSTGIIDFSVLEGYRGEEKQNEAFNTGKSKLKYPQSKHNMNPSRAVDIAPYPIDWNNRERFAKLAGVILACAHEVGVKVVWGGDWKTFKDLPHFELEDKTE